MIALASLAMLGAYAHSLGKMGAHNLTTWLEHRIGS